jgi:predicted SprT family Zn-dependent metalloprotease
MMQPVCENAKAYDLAFTHLNEELYGGKLPIPMLMLTRDRRITMGHFAPRRWAGRRGDERIHEIAVNVNCGANREPVTVFGVLAHEMTHLWQQEHGHPTRNGYHNKEWEREARRIGLLIQGGGQKVHTEVEPEGLTEAAIASMPKAAAFPWISAEVDSLGALRPKGQPQVRSGHRSRYTCPICGLHAWAKPEASLVCGTDGQELVEQAKEG